MFFLIFCRANDSVFSEQVSKYIFGKADQENHPPLVVFFWSIPILKQNSPRSWRSSSVAFCKSKCVKELRFLHVPGCRRHRDLVVWWSRRRRETRWAAPSCPSCIPSSRSWWGRWRIPDMLNFVNWLNRLNYVKWVDLILIAWMEVFGIESEFCKFGSNGVN